jgi:uncharacterized protein YhhL (DUF1145 family)
MSPPKLGVAAAWILAIVAMFAFAGSVLGSVGRLVFYFMVIAHAIECVVFLPRLRQAPGGLGTNLLQVFLFGVFHMRELQEKQG